MLRLGLFTKFKGFDAVVLIAADESGIVTLVHAIAEASRTNRPLAIHDLCEVSVKHRVRLYLSSAKRPRSMSTEYFLSVRERRASIIQGLLNPLRVAPSGHQYFALTPSSAELMVSVGEYDSNWWRGVDV